MNMLRVISPLGQAAIGVVIGILLMFNGAYWFAAVILLVALGWAVIDTFRPRA
jgi:hypothetical protein